MTSAPTSHFKTGLSGRCPNCGKAKLFKNLLDFVDKCPECVLPIGEHDNGDGAAFIAIFLVGAIIVGLAIWVDFTYTPPLWVHAALWLPLTLVFSIILLRFFKGMMLALQVRHRGLDKNSSDKSL